MLEYDKGIYSWWQVEVTMKLLNKIWKTQNVDNKSMGLFCKSQFSFRHYLLIQMFYK